jgi:hypothetical protein
MKLTLAAALVLSVSAAHAGPVLPPAQFDHPFAGKLVVTDGLFQDELRVICGLPNAKVVLGCAHIPRTHGLDGQTCHIFLATPDIVARAGQTRDQLFRHERGHCLGWRHPIDPNSPEAREDERISQERLREEQTAQQFVLIPTVIPTIFDLLFRSR